MLQDELSALELELADPSNPLLNVDSDGNRIDAGELIKNLVDVRGRLEKVKKGKEGRLKLIEMASGKERKQSVELAKAEPVTPVDENAPKFEHQNMNIAGMDKRIGTLEALVGSSSMSLDEVLLFFFILWLKSREFKNIFYLFISGITSSSTFTANIK